MTGERGGERLGGGVRERQTERARERQRQKKSERERGRERSEALEMVYPNGLLECEMPHLCVI